MIETFFLVTWRVAVSQLLGERRQLRNSSFTSPADAVPRSLLPTGLHTKRMNPSSASRFRSHLSKVHLEVLGGHLCGG